MLITIKRIKGYCMKYIKKNCLKWKSDLVQDLVQEEENQV